MRAQPVGLIGGFYKDSALPWACQDTVNWLPTRAEVSGTRTPWKLETCPGLRESLWLGDAASPIRGMHDLEGQLYFVSGQTLYRVRADGAVDALGLIPGVSRVQMTHNQFSTGYQLLVENGQGGGGYVYTTSTGAFAKITDEGYPGSISSDYLDSYLLGVEPQGRFWFHSNLADATDYNTLDRYEAEAAPDRIVGLAVSQFEVVVFGQRTVEFFFNAGGQTGTFQNRRQSITRGCSSRHTIQKLDNSLFWLGDDGIVYRLDGYAARRISTQPLEKAIAGYNWSEALAYVWEDRGYKVYYLTFPDGLTFGYDVVTGLWTRRESFGLSRWRPSHMTKCNGKWYAGDFQTGRLWIVDWNYYLEGQAPLVRRHVTGVLEDNQSQILVPNAELIVATGAVPTTPQAPLDPASQYPSIGTITGSLPSWKHFEDYSADLSYSSTSSLLSVAFSGGDQLPPGAQVTINSGAGKIHIAIPGTETKPKNPLRISIRARDSLGRYILWQGDLAIIGYTWDGTWDTRSIGVGSGTSEGFTLPARNGTAGAYFTRSATDAVAAVSSTDTSSWASIGAAIPAGMTAERGMAYSPTLARLVYAGRYDTYYWTGTAWTGLTNGTNKYLEDLQWCAGISRFIAVGRADQAGYFYYSTDGASITGVSVLPGRTYRAAYSQALNRVVLRDRQGSGKYSDNGGVTWQDCTGANIPSASTDERVVWCGDRFITAANRSGGVNIYESVNGVGPWTPVAGSPALPDNVYVAYSPQINELIVSIGTSIYRHVPGSGVFSLSSTRTYAATAMGYVENSRQIFRMIGRSADSNVDITRIG